MAKGKFKCAKCKRSFSMAAHLARHNNTIHGGRSKGKGVVRGLQGRRGRAAAGIGGIHTVTNFATASADGLLGDMQAYHSGLQAQRMSIDAQIDAVARAMEVMGASVPAASAVPGKRRRGRPPGQPGSLKDFIVRVLRASSAPLSPNQIGKRVKKAGYKTKAKDLTKAVSNTLPDLKRVKRLGFGSYKLA